MENNIYKIGEPFNLQVEITDESRKQEVIERLQYILNSNYSEILPGLKLNKIFKSSNNIDEIKSKNTEISMTTPIGKIKQPQTAKVDTIRKSQGYVDIEDKQAVQEMFNSFRI